MRYRCCGLDVNIAHECMKVSYDAAAAVSIVTASDLPLPCSVQVTWSEPSLKKTHTHGFSKGIRSGCASSACSKSQRGLYLFIVTTVMISCISSLGSRSLRTICRTQIGGGGRELKCCIYCFDQNN